MNESRQACETSRVSPTNGRANARWRYVLLGGVAVAITAWGAASKLPAVERLAEILGAANWGALAFVLAGCVVYRVANAAVWSWVLAAVGHPCEVRPATRMWLLSEACRWLPGSLWNYGSRVVVGGRQGVPATTVGAGLALELALTVGAWFAVAAAGLALAGMSGMSQELLKLPRPTPQFVSIVASGLIVVVGLIGLPAVRRRAGGKLSKVTERFQQLRRLRFRARPAAAAALGYVALGVFQGLLCWCLLRAIAPEHPVSWTAVVGVNAAGWIAGFVAVFAPAGIGVREGAMVVGLAAFVPWEILVAVVAVWRVLHVAAELICLGGIAAVPHASTNAVEPEQANSSAEQEGFRSATSLAPSLE